MFSPEYASALATAARNQGIVLPIHVKLDCGMHRLGFDPADPTKIYSAVTEKGLLPTGIYTHFPVADADAKATLQSLKQLLACRFALCDKGLSLFAHTAASAALFNLPESVLDGVRPGLALYGMSPVPTTLPLRPALSLFAPVVQVHNLPTGTPIGYGGDFITQSPTRVGTVPIGYGDGIPRRFSGQTVRVFHQNKPFSAPIIGRICMDQMMLDLTQTPAKAGDFVQIFEDIPKVATALGTIPYEVLTSLSPRIARRKRENQTTRTRK